MDRYNDKLVDDDNNSFHRTIRMTPAVEASKSEYSAWHNIYGAYYSTAKYGKPMYKVGQTVRITKYKKFSTRDLPNYGTRTNSLKLKK